MTNTLNKLPSPLTPEQIELERNATQKIITANQKRIKLTKFFSILGAATATIVFVYLCIFGSVTDVALTVSIGVIIPMGVILTTVAFMFTDLSAFFVAILVAIVGIQIGLVLGVAERELTVLVALALLVVGFALLVVAHEDVCDFLFDTSAAKNRLNELKELNKESGECCVQYLKWCQSDHDLKAYQDQIGKMARLPIMLDYKNAHDWINNRQAGLSQQEKQVQASEACKTLAEWPTALASKIN